MTEECCENELYYFRSLQIYAQDAKRKASFLVDDLDKIVSGTKEPHVYALQQLAKDLKQYADDALRIAGDIVTLYEQERRTKHELHRISRKQLLLELNRISYIAHKVTSGSEIDSWQAVSEIEGIVEQLLENEKEQ